MLRALLAALVLAVPAGPPLVPAAATASPAAAAVDRGSYPTISVSDHRVRLGRTVVVSGRGPGLRHLVLELRTGQRGWQALAHTTTGVGGRYSFVAPGWVGTHRLRVVAPGGAVVKREVSDTVRVTVRVPYRPKGVRSDWRWLSHRAARWDPCTTITYRVNPRGGYRAATSDVRRAFDAVGAVTGIRFQYLGTTSARVQRSRHGVHPVGTDILVDWQTPRQDRALSGRVAGIGGHWVLGNRRFDGYMLLDRSERHPRAVWRQVMVHEVGHILGLGHARSRTQLMHGTSTPANRLWGRGDLAALRRVCRTEGCLGPRTQRAAVGTGPLHVGRS